MPITPRYNLTQTPAHVQIEVSIPHVRVSSSTLDLVIVDGKELHLDAPPVYLLKLTLPGRVVDEDALVDRSAYAASAGASDDVRLIDADANCIYEEDCVRKKSALMTCLWTKEDLPKLQYNPEKNHGTLLVILRKTQEGFWKDLDLMGRLQHPTRRQRQKKQYQAHWTGNIPFVKEVDAEDEGENESDANSVDESEHMEDLLSINRSGLTYGLFQNFSNIFCDYAREGLAHEMLECPNPDEINNSIKKENGCEDDHDAKKTRREMRLEIENEKFDPGRYLNDLNIEEETDMIFHAAMVMVPHWMSKESVASQNGSEAGQGVVERFSSLSTSDDQLVFFTSDESHLLAMIPIPKNNLNKLTTEQKRAAFFSLVDILFAYAYDHRTTNGDPTVESSWTVMILSPSLAWLEGYNPPYDAVVDVIRWSIRRSLIYPYLRSHALAIRVVLDVYRIIKGGRRTVLRCLLQLHQIMEQSESHYLFNKLFVDPLIGWTQWCHESEVQEFGKEVECLLMHTNYSTNMDSSVINGNNADSLSKENLGLGLVDLERFFFEQYGQEESISEGED